MREKIENKLNEESQSVDLEESIEITGLTDAEVEAALLEFGYNEITEKKENLYWGVLKRLWGPIPCTLETALLLEIILGKILQASIIAVLLLFSAIVGETQERRARKVVGYLKQHLQVTVRVLRNGIWQFIAARDLVFGDYIHIKAGDIIPADCTIFRGSIELDQSVLTGESESVLRSEYETIYSASVVRLGEAIALVTATGTYSFFGKTAELVKNVSAPGHLQKLLFAVVRNLAIIDIILAVILLIAALLNSYAILPLLPFIVVLVIATVPVSMPASFTVANAMEARVLAKEGVLVTGLTAIQEAATMQVLCIDKTGTLTQNKPQIASVFSFSDYSEDELLAYAASTCDPSSLNPIDIAILKEVEKRSLHPFIREGYIPFDPVRKASSALINLNGYLQEVILGSPFVMESYAVSIPQFKEKVAEMAVNGGRVLAIAIRREGEGRVCGLLTFSDLPAEDAASLVQDIKDLGIRLMMITGDTPPTAKAMARKLNMGERIGPLSAALKVPLDYDGIANVYPEEKYQIIQALQELNLTVGMTGDGINDAPALKQAEVGIAVSSAADVAKASAKIVLTDPGLQGIVRIIHGGRRVYSRMMTWTITKITRTLELAVLLTIGYLATGDFVVPLSLIVLIIVFNDLVTITLGTDRAWVSSTLEQWNVKSISKLSGILAAGWLLLAFLILWLTLNVLKLPFVQIQTLMFLYLIYSAQATIYITRVRKHFWSFLPSGLVMAVTLGNIFVSSLFALCGILMAQVSPLLVIALLAVVVLASFGIDLLKIHFYKRQKHEKR